MIKQKKFKENSSKKFKNYFKSKRSQEELIGFVLIIVIVAIILLVFLGFSLRNNSQKETVESYEVESFIYVSLQYTSDCKNNFEYLSIQKLISSCVREENCLYEEQEKNSCEVLNSTLKNILKESWPIGDERPVKGYKFNITSEGLGIISLSEGNFTGNSKGSSQDFIIRGNTIDIFFKAYY